MGLPAPTALSRCGHSTCVLWDIAESESILNNISQQNTAATATRGLPAECQRVLCPGLRERGPEAREHQAEGRTRHGNHSTPPSTVAPHWRVCAYRLSRGPGPHLPTRGGSELPLWQRVSQQCDSIQVPAVQEGHAPGDAPHKLGCEWHVNAELHGNVGNPSSGRSARLPSRAGTGPRRH